MAFPRCAVKEFEARSGPPPCLVKRVRIVDARDPVWPFTRYLQLEIRGDSSLVVNWTNAVWACKTGHVTPITSGSWGQGRLAGGMDGLFTSAVS